MDCGSGLSRDGDAIAWGAVYSLFCVSKPIEVFRRNDGSTGIKVRNYPDGRAHLRVRSAGGDGRRLEALGWANFRRSRVLGHIVVHIEDRRPLLITEFGWEEHTLEAESDEILGRLLVCAESLALELHDKLGIDDGWVDWQVADSQLSGISALYDRYKPVARRVRRGMRCLRCAPTSAGSEERPRAPGAASRATS